MDQDGLDGAFTLKNKPPTVRFTIDIMSAECTVDTSKAQRDLGYQPIISVDEGIRTMPLLGKSRVFE